MAKKDGVEEVSDGKFKEILEKNSLVVVDFFAEWCMPCLMMAPVFEEIAEKFKGKAEFAKVNIDENSEIANKHNIVSIPTIVIFKDKKEKNRITGTVSAEQLEEKLRSLIK